MNINRSSYPLENSECVNLPRVLIVEDETSYQCLIDTSLSAHNYETLTVCTGSAAIDAAAQERFALILLDTDLPDRTGYEVCERIREFSQVPIVMLPTSYKIEDIVKSLGAGADDCVPKPFTSEELSARVHAVSKQNANLTRLCPDCESSRQ